MRDLLVFSIPIVLFGILLVIMLRFRSLDKKDRGLDLMKRYVSQHQSQMERSGADMKQNMVTAEEIVSEKYQELMLLSQQLDVRLKDLSDHVGDLDELHRVMVYYHDVLGQLVVLTDTAEHRTVQVDKQIREIDGLGKHVDEFKSQATVLFDSIDQKKQELQKFSDSRQLFLNEDANKIAIRIQTQFDQYFESMIARSDKLFGIMTDAVRSSLQELDQRMAMIESLSEHMDSISLHAMDEVEKRITKARETLDVQDVSRKVLYEQRKLLGDELASLEQSRVHLESTLSGLHKDVAIAHSEREQIEAELQHKRDMEQQLDSVLVLKQEKDRQLDADLDSKQLVLTELDVALKEMQATMENEERKALLKRVSIDEHGDEPDIDLDIEPDADPDISRRSRIEHGLVATEVEEEEDVLEL